MKSVLITECTNGGIGSALAEVFHEQGLHVFATARDTSKMAHLAKFSNMTLLTLDVTNPSQISEAVEAVKNHADGTGTLDYLVNNAGRGYFMPTMDINISEAKQIFEANFWGPLAMMQAFCPLLIASKGTIVNISSLSGHLNVPFIGLYAGSKSALEVLSDTLRLEMQPFGVNVVEVIFGSVASNGQSYFGDLELPSNSMYKPIEATFIKFAQGGDDRPRMETKDFANSVVSDVLAGATGKIWKGPSAERVKNLVGTVPQSTLDNMVVTGTDLDKLAAAQIEKN